MPLELHQQAPARLPCAAVRGLLFLLLLLAPLIAIACEADSPPPPEPSEPRKAAVREFWALHDRARDLYAAEDFVGASRAYTAALSLDPRHITSLYNLAFCEFRLGQHREALARLQEVEDIDRRETKPKLLAALILSDPRPAGPFDLARARDQAARAVELNREESGPFLLQGRIASLAGDLDEARERLALASQANPLSAEALNLLGVLLLRAGDAPAALLSFQKALSAARGAPPAAGLPGEGDTARAGAGYQRQQLLQAAWLSVLAGGDRGACAASSLPPLGEGECHEAPGQPLRSGRALVAADLDGDGVPEVAAGSLDGPVALYSLRDSGLVPRASLPLSGVSFLSVVDIDGDGGLDLYALRGGELGQGEPRLLLARGGLRFEEAPVPGGQRRAIAALAVRTERRSEIIEVGAGGSLAPVRVIAFEGGHAALREVAGIARGECALSIAPLSAPGAAGPDLVVAFAGRPPLLLRREGESWAPVATSSEAQGLDALGVQDRVAALDLDGDGWDDLAVGRSSSALDILGWLVEGKVPPPPLRLLRRVGPERFEPAALALPQLASRVSGLAARDVDGDGRADLLVLGSGPEPWHVEPWWVLLRRGERFELRRGPQPAGALSVAAAEPAPGSRPLLVVAGGGLLPSDRGGLWTVAVEDAAP